MDSDDDYENTEDAEADIGKGGRSRISSFGDKNGSTANI